MRSALTLAAFALSLIPALPMAAGANDVDPPRLTVTGTGEVAVVPDMAVVSLSVIREAPNAAEALDALATASEAVLGQVTAAGIAARDVQTGQLSLDPQWSRDEQGRADRIEGYVARTTVEVRVRDLDGLGPLLDAVVSEGANGLGGLRLTVAEPRLAEDRARAAAVTDALARAEVLAAAAGLRLGPVLSIREGAAAGPGPVMMEMAAARAMPVAAGEVTLAVDVTLVVELVAP